MKEITKDNIEDICPKCGKWLMPFGEVSKCMQCKKFYKKRKGKKPRRLLLKPTIPEGEKF